MSFVNGPPNETTPDRSQNLPKNQKSQKKSKKKRKRKGTTPKKQETEVMSKLKAVKQQISSKSLIDSCDFGLSQKQQPPTRWDMSAITLLNMTLTFLRHVPEVCMTLYVQ